MEEKKIYGTFKKVLRVFLAIWTLGLSELSMYLGRCQERQIIHDEIVAKQQKEAEEEKMKKLAIADMVIAQQKQNNQELNFPNTEAQK